MATTQKTMTPNQLAEKLVGKENAEKVAKAFVRPFLRRNFTRGSEAKGSSWTLDAKQIKAVTDAWKKAHS